MKQSNMLSFGQRLRRERENRYWTQEELADKLGISVPSINRWEHDRAVPRPETLRLLEEAFDRPLEDWGTDRPKPWNIPFLRNPHFTGREQILQRLHQALAAGQIVSLNPVYAISGLGGIGKTQTAIEYAYRYADKYEAVLWVRADSHETLISDFAALAAVLGLREQEETDQLRAIAAVKRWLETHSHWLLIFDNVDNINLVSGFFPTRGQGAVLLTTRSQLTSPYIRKIQLDKMSREEGVTFLLRRAAVERDMEEENQPRQITEEERRAAQGIWEQMDGLPLALDQAAAYIEETASSLANYRQLYDKWRMELLTRRGGIIPDHPESVVTTWRLSFQKVQEQFPAAIELLRLCTYLAPDAIPEEIVIKGASFFGPLLEPVAENSFLLDQAIQVLRAYSLMQRDPHRKTLSIHRLVQAILRDTLSEEERHIWRERAMRAVNAAFPHVEPETWSRCERMFLQALSATQLIEQDQMRSEEAGRLLYETASYLQDRAYYEEAELLYLRALHIREQQLGPEHPDVAYPLNGLAELYREQGRYEKAEPLYLRALHIREQQLGPEHPDVAYPLNGLAILYYQQGKYAEAEALFQQTLVIREQQLGSGHSDVAHSLTGLAILCSEQGKYEEAELLFQRALCICEKVQGPEHPDVAYPLNGLAELYREQGRYEKAEPLYLRTLHIREQQLGPEHPQTAEIIHNFARYREAQGSCEEARVLYTRALAIYEQVLGAYYFKTTDIRKRLTTLLYTMGEHEKASQLETAHMSEHSF